MLSGGTNIRELLEQDVRIWTGWFTLILNRFGRGPRAVFG